MNALARAAIAVTAWLLLTLPAGYAIAAIGIGNTGATWIYVGFGIAALTFSPLLTVAFIRTPAR